MSQRFIKGLTNNHLTWVMVDATDFATPESALSAATKIKIYGKLAGGTGTNFVSSGTGSLTNDITHVGASALGIYTIALVKADLSDASAAWYNQYIISLSATGAAYQTLVVDGGIHESNVSATLSDAQSYLVAMSGMLSDTHSAAILGASNASEAQSQATLAASRALLMISTLSDIDSAITSQYSDLESKLTSQFTYLSGTLSDMDSAVTSQYSDIESKLSSQFVYTSAALSDMHSDLKSAMGDVSVAISASDISDIASAVAAAIGFTPSGIAAKVWSDFESKAGASPSQLYSVVNLTLSRASDIQSYLVAMSGALSDLDSAVTSQYSDLESKLTSQFAAVSDAVSNVYSATLLTQSLASEAQSVALQINSRVLLAASTLSDIDSALSSQFVATSATLSDIDSALSSQFAAASDAVSNVYSAITSTRAEPGQGSPGATIAPLAKLDYLYKAWRNRHTQTASEYALYADDATTKDHEAAVSDNGTTLDRGEVTTGA
jgi:Flp pilus assembly pilin Flp